MGLLITPCHGTGDGAELSWLHPAAFAYQDSETARAPFCLLLICFDFLKKSYVCNLQVHREGEGDKKLCQFLAPFPHARLELALAGPHPVTWSGEGREGTSVGVKMQAAASGKLSAFSGAK